MSPVIRRARSSSARVRWMVAAASALAVAVGVLWPLAASADHAEPTFPLTASTVEAISDCAPPPPDNGTAIPTGQAGNATTPPDRNNTSSSNEHTPGTVQDLVIHANAESDPKENTLDISGSHNVLDGLVNSRSHLKIGGSWNLLRHGTDYGQRSEQGKVAFDLTGSNNCFSPIPTQTYENDPPSPAGFPLFNRFDPDQDGNILEHFAPGSVAAIAAMGDPAPGPQYFVCGIADPDGPGTNAATAPGCAGSGASAIMDRNVQGQTLETGLYFVTGRVKISASSVPNATVTIVSGQQLNVNGSVQGQVINVFNPYTDATGKRPGDLLFASQWDEAANLSGTCSGSPTVCVFPDGSTSSDSPNTDKAEDALKVEGSLSRFEGIIVATNGRTELAGEQLDFRCPVMGDRVRLNGSKNYFNAAGCVAGPGLQISKTPDGNVTVNAGDNAEFTITVTNAGSGPANNVDIDDVFPGTGWILVSAQKQGAALPAGDSCTITPAAPNGNTLHCDIAVLGPGENVVVVVRRATTAADCGGDTGTGIRLDNGSLTPDPSDDATADADNNPPVTDPGHIIVRCPDAKVEKTPDNGTVNAGQTATFTITVTALGPGTSFNVKLDDPPLPNNPPFLPDSGFDWTLGGANAASCTLTGAPGSEILHCDFGNITFPGSRTITLSTPTDAADCAKGLVTNPVRISGDGDTNAGNNSDTGSLTVICSAIRINKDSAKGGPVLVAGATFTISPHPTGAAGTFTVVDNGTNDSDPAIGEICVTPVSPGVLYTIEETVPPAGYGLPDDVTETTTPAAGGTCASGAGTVTFVDPPLVDIQARFRSQVANEATLVSPISCNNTTGTSSGADTAGWDDTLTVTGIRTVTSPATVTVTCTFVIDP